MTHTLTPLVDTKHDLSVSHEIDLTDSSECCICRQCNEDDSTQLIQCTQCSILVHAQCYGAPLINIITTDNWCCDACHDRQSQLSSSTSSESIECCLCSAANNNNRTGALKRTTDWRWCHISCALWIPECFYRLPDLRDTIDILQIPQRRYNNQCCICNIQQGCTVQCSTGTCDNSFHITCGMNENTYLDYKQSNNANIPDTIVSLCNIHSKKYKNKKKR